MSDFKKIYLDKSEQAKECLDELAPQMRGASSSVIVSAVERGLRKQQEAHDDLPSNGPNPMNNA